MPEPFDATTAPDEVSPSFETALGQIEQIVSELERGTLDLDASLSRYERGVRLLAQCRTTLQTAERRVALLTGISPEGDPLTSPFDAPVSTEDDLDDV